MLQALLIDFSRFWDEHLSLMVFAYNNSYQATIQLAPFEALYGSRCRRLVFWEEVGAQQLLGLELVQVTNAAVEKIKQRILTAQNRQKSYADLRRRDLKFEVGDHVFPRVVAIRRVLRFKKKGKLSPRFISLFKILEQVGVVAYRIALPSNLAAVHDVFHV